MWWSKNDATISMILVASFTFLFFGFLWQLYRITIPPIFIKCGSWCCHATMNTRQSYWRKWFMMW
jgi:hypothetical protein